MSENIPQYNKKNQVLHLMNSAMMPTEGQYVIEKITPQIALMIFQGFTCWQSYIGYQNTSAYLEKILGVKIPLSREETHLENHDEVIVCKLRYRPGQVGMKADPKEQSAVKDEDFELYHVTYSSQN